MMSVSVSQPSAQLVFRAYRPGDEREIVSLFETSFGKPMSLQYWNWRYRDNPVDAPLVELAWDGDQLVGHYAVSPVPMVVDGERCKAALSMTAMTHPDYRGRGLFPALAERLYARLMKQGYRMVYGFPNSQTHRTFRDHLGWTDLAPIPQMSVAIGDLRHPSSSTRSFATADQFSDWFSSIGNARRGISIARDATFFNWRTVEEPDQTYRIGMSGGQGGLGFAVFKRFGDAVDLVDFSADVDTLGALVASVAALAEKDGAKRINTWLPVFDPLFPSLERLGFVPKGPVTYMGAKFFRPGTDLLDSRKWSIRMVMSDVL